VVDAAPVRVVVADDQAGVRGQIRRALEAGGCTICGECATAAEAVALTFEHKPDIALLDIHMPGSGIWAAQQISDRQPRTAVVMLTHSTTDDDLFDSLRAGAAGYLVKGTDPAELPDALRAVLAGEAAIPASLVTRILAEFRGPSRPRFRRRSAAGAKLSAREWEVMEMLAQGHSTEEVGRRLFIAPTTVRVHVSTVLRKLRVKDRTSAFRLLRGEK
jgi:DNA-binding NarL/FixJ family response regulator